ncbi:MAG TPA: helix-turn-helix transcriptional regulator [Dehalococcoidia bacterium]
MTRQPTEHDLNERIEIWRGVSYWKGKLGMSSMQLAQRTGLSQDSIERGIRGQPEPVMHKLQELFDAFGLKSTRQKSFEDTSDILSEDEYKEGLKPPPAAPPRQGSLFDDGE